MTGGSRGLGLAIARELTRRGARVVICGRDPDELGRAREQLGDAMAAVCDVTQPAEVAHLVSDVRLALGPIDVVFKTPAPSRSAPSRP